jgi:hypothetical protein
LRYDHSDDVQEKLNLNQQFSKGFMIEKSGFNDFIEKDPPMRQTLKIRLPHTFQMWLCITVTLASIQNPCEEIFLSNFQANCSTPENGYCVWDEWMCVTHEQGSVLTSPCLSNISGCLLTFDSDTGACFGQCLNNEQLLGIAIAAIVIGLLLCVAIIVSICLGCCCCCRYITSQTSNCWCWLKKKLSREPDMSENLLQSVDACQPQAYPEPWQTMVPVSPLQGYFVQFPQPGVIGYPILPQYQNIPNPAETEV